MRTECHDIVRRFSRQPVANAPNERFEDTITQLI